LLGGTVETNKNFLRGPTGPRIRVNMAWYARWTQRFTFSRALAAQLRSCKCSVGGFSEGQEHVHRRGGSMCVRSRRGTPSRGVPVEPKQFFIRSCRRPSTAVVQKSFHTRVTSCIIGWLHPGIRAGSILLGEVGEAYRQESTQHVRHIAPASEMSLAWGRSPGRTSGLQSQSRREGRALAAQQHRRFLGRFEPQGPVRLVIVEPHSVVVASACRCRKPGPVQPVSELGVVVATELACRACS
jgi:hypothetical protein